MNNIVVALKLFCKRMIGQIAGHTALVVGTVVVIACLATLYYMFQHGVLDDKAKGDDDKIIEIPLGD